MSTVVVDPHVQFPEIGEIRSAVLAGDWTPIAAYIDRWRDRDPQRATLAIHTVTETDGAAAFLAAQPTDRLVRTTLANLRIVEGWEIRGHGRASTVSERQWDGFHAKLGEAERDLIELAATDPSDTLVAWTRLFTGRGLSLSLSEQQRRYARLAAAAPHHLPGQLTHLQTLAPKWAGSTELMFEFARNALAVAPGSSAGRLVAIAHFEHWLDLPDNQGTAYITSPAVHTELMQAAEASVFHRDYEPGLRWLTDHSWFAHVYSVAERPDLARHHFELMGDMVDPEPWKYWNNAMEQLHAHRGKALGRGV